MDNNEIASLRNNLQMQRTTTMGPVHHNRTRSWVLVLIAVAVIFALYKLRPFCFDYDDDPLFQYF